MHLRVGAIRSCTCCNNALHINADVACRCDTPNSSNQHMLYTSLRELSLGCVAQVTVLSTQSSNAGKYSQQLLSPVILVEKS